MSSKNKLSKQFKNAVAASSPSSSRSSSPKSSSSSTFTPLTVSQANTLQTLHQEHLARLASITLPHLASSHSRRFLHLARTQMQASDSMWSTQKLQAVRYRRCAWAEDVEPEPNAVMGGEKEGEEIKVVPDFYHKHNGRCKRCALPLVAGLNCVTVSSEGDRKVGKKGRGRSRKRVSSCTLCHHKTRTS